MKTSRYIVYFGVLFLSFSCSEKVEEVLERYKKGTKKIVGIYSGSGSNEILLRKEYFYEDGNIKQKENFNQLGERHGEFYSYYKDGKIKSKFIYNTGLIMSGFEYYIDGSLIREYKDGSVFNGSSLELEGPICCFDVKQEILLDGVYDYFIRDVTLIDDTQSVYISMNSCRGEIKEGIRDGFWSFESGTRELHDIMVLGYYKNGKKDGEWTYLLRRNYPILVDREKIVSKYKNGKLIETKEY